MKLTTGIELIGPAGIATEVIAEFEPEDSKQATATVVTWLLNCPGQSPFWNHYALSVIHLRPIEGVENANIRVPGATHEVFLAALDPGRNPEATNEMTWLPLTPFNAYEQVELPDDEAAKELAYHAARAVVDGYLPAEPPLSGPEPWRTALIKTAAHMRGEDHAP